jgi:hypothetical protein
MNSVVQNLLNLQTLEFGDVQNAEIEAQITQLRALIPPQIMGHYDRLRARDKKGVAVVRNQTCTGCHMRLPIGVITVLMRDEDIRLCETCGRYLYLPPAPPVTEQPKAEKPAPKPRKRKAAAAPAPAA